MFLGLRMTEGVDLQRFERLFGCRMEEIYGEVIRKNLRDGLLRYLPGDAGKSQSEVQEPSGLPCRALPSDGRKFPAGDRDTAGEIPGKADGGREVLPVDGKVPGDSLRLALTDRGLDLSNYVMAQFLG